MQQAMNATRRAGQAMQQDWPHSRTGKQRIQFCIQEKSSVPSHINSSHSRLWRWTDGHRSLPNTKHKTALYP
jgi:hypothetical protein